MGSYRYAAAEGSWQWSDGVYAIHGFRRGEVVPSTALLLAHAHPADRRHAAQLLESCLHNGELFSFPYRLVDASGQLRRALIAGEGIVGCQGQVTGLRGYLIDVTEPQSRARTREVPSTLRKAIAARAVIEQAKGALMLVYGLDAEAAFAVLSWQSQHANIKLRELAERLVSAVGGDASATAALRQHLDEIVYSLPAEPTPDGPDAEELLAVEQESLSGVVLLRLRGEIDMSTGPQLDHYLAAAVAAGTAPAPIVVDLSGVQHLGSVGVALLTSYHRRCQEAGTPLRIVVVAGPAASALAMIPTGLDLHARVADALSPESQHGLPAHLSEMIGRYDWAATPLEPLPDWPASLCTAVDICVSSSAGPPRGRPGGRGRRMVPEPAAGVRQRRGPAGAGRSAALARDRMTAMAWPRRGRPDRRGQVPLQQNGPPDTRPNEGGHDNDDGHRDPPAGADHSLSGHASEEGAPVHHPLG